MPKSYHQLAAEKQPVTAISLAIAEIQLLIAAGETAKIDEVLNRHGYDSNGPPGLDFSLPLVDFFWKQKDLAVRNHYFNSHVFSAPPARRASSLVHRLRETVNHFADQGDVTSLRKFLGLATKSLGGVPTEVVDAAMLHAASTGNAAVIEVYVPVAKQRLFSTPKDEAYTDLGTRVLLAAAKHTERLPSIARAVLRYAPADAFIGERALEPLLRAGVDDALQVIIPRPRDLNSSGAALRLKQVFTAAAAAQRTDLLAKIAVPFLHNHDILYALHRVVETAPGQEQEATRMFDVLTQKRPELWGKFSVHLGAAILNGSSELARHLQQRGVQMPTNGRYYFHQRLWKREASILKAAHQFQDLRASLKTGWNVFMFDKENTEWSSQKAELLVDAIGKHSPELRGAKFVRRAAEHHPATVNVLLDAGVEFPLEAAIKLLDANEDVAARRVVDQFLAREGFVPKDPLCPKLKLKTGSKESQTKLLSMLHERGVNLTAQDIKSFLTNPFSPDVNAKLLAMPGAEHIDRNKLPEGIMDGVEKFQAWQRNFHSPPPIGLECCSPHGFRPKTFEIVRGWLREELDIPNGSPRIAALNQQAYKLTCLFTSEDRVRQYLERHGRASRRPLTDLAKFSLPPNGKWPVKPWADFVLKFGPAATKYLPYADRVPPAPSLRRLRAEVAGLTYPQAHKNPRLATLCMELDLPKQRFARALEVASGIDPKVSAKNIPDITIDGMEFGRPGFTWRRAAPGDPRILLAGELTGCCQKIDGEGEPAAIHSASSANGGCYFLTQNRHGMEEVVGVAWAWRGQHGELCLDSFEPSSPIHASCFQEIVKSMAQRLETEHPDVTSFTVGTGGRTPVLGYPTREGNDAAAPINYEQYRDSNSQYLVFSKDGYEVGRAAQALIEASIPHHQVDLALDVGHG